MLRVLHVNDFPANHGGGAEMVMSRSVELLRRAGCVVDVFTSADLPDDRLSLRRYIDNPIARRCLSERIEAFQPDVVHLHNFYHRLSPGILVVLAEYKRRRPLRVVMTAHDSHLVCPNSGGTWFPRRAPRRPIDSALVQRWSYLLSRSWDHRGFGHSCLKLAQHVWNYRWGDRRRVLDTVICPSRFLRDLFARAGCPAVVVPNPNPSWQVQPAGERGPRLNLMFVGRVEPEKGLAEFLELLPASFDGTITIVGDGSDVEHCRTVSRERGLDVVFLGRRPHAEVGELLRQAHVAVVPALVLETYALVAIEALSVGTNVLVSDLGAPREIVEASGAGYVFTAGDAASLARQMERITAAHQERTLNRFDVTAFLESRSEQAYLAALLRVYESAGVAFA